MKRILAPILLALTFSVMFSSTSYAEWEATSRSAKGTSYVNVEKIQTKGKYVYFWVLSDSLKPIKGSFSHKTKIKGDCKTLRMKRLKAFFYKNSMGRGILLGTLNKPQKNWTRPSGNSMDALNLKLVCAYAK
jgi:hypothetical protein